MVIYRVWVSVIWFSSIVLSLRPVTAYWWNMFVPESVLMRPEGLSTSSRGLVGSCKAGSLLDAKLEPGGLGDSACVSESALSVSRSQSYRSHS